jgi:hypothetical protein
MANPFKGDHVVKITVGDEERDYKFRYDMDALVELEEALDLPIAQIVPLLQVLPIPRLKVLRALMYAGLKANHPEMTPRLAGELLTLMTPETAAPAINEAFALAFPPKEGGGEAGGGADDPTETVPAAGGTGHGSANGQSKTD